MHKRPILLGQAPSRQGDGRPFSGPSGQRLCSLLGFPYDYERLAKKLDLRNLIDEHQPKHPAGKGDQFDRVLASRGWRELIDLLPENFTLIAAGRSVSGIVGITGPFFRANAMSLFTSDGRRVLGWGYIMPHPSGISHYWNDPQSVRAAADFLTRIIARASHPSASG